MDSSATREPNFAFQQSNLLQLYSVLAYLYGRFLNNNREGKFKVQVLNFDLLFSILKVTSAGQQITIFQMAGERDQERNRFLRYF